MGGETLTQSPLQGTVGDAGRASEKVAGDGEEGGEGRYGGRGGDNRGQQHGEGGAT